jgi:hypothetical protein
MDKEDLARQCGEGRYGQMWLVAREGMDWIVGKGWRELTGQVAWVESGRAGVASRAEGNVAA